MKRLIFLDCRPTWIAWLPVILLLAACGKSPEPPEETEQTTQQPKPVAQTSPTAPVQPADKSGTSLAEELVASTHTDDLTGIRERRELRVLVTYSPTDFFFDEEGTARGMQVELINEYEKLLNKGIKRRENKTRITFIPTTFDRLIPDLIDGKGDVAAAMLTITTERLTKVDFATGEGMLVDELVVTSKDTAGIDSVDDLSGRTVYVIRGSSYAEHLRDLNRNFEHRDMTPIDIREADSHLLSKDILELVNSGVIEITVIDDYAARLWAQVLPNVNVLEDVKISSENVIGWAVRKENPELLNHLNDFARTIKKGTLTGNILFKRYYENTKWIDNPTSKNERDKLSELLAIFRKYADRYQFDHLAIAAQAYHESRLDHGRTSHKGAVGIMQILPSTAADPNVDISDIQNLENNIHAGVKYLAFLRDRYFSEPEIAPLDRSAFAWAAYNAGPAKVREMRSKAEKMGLDPNVWFSNVEVAAAKTVGREPVEYVSKIYKYYVAYRLVSDRTEALPL